MSLSSLVSGSGTDCGPSNPLQHLSKTFGGDRGVQQVRTAFAMRSDPWDSSLTLLGRVGLYRITSHLRLDPLVRLVSRISRKRESRYCG